MNSSNKKPDLKKALASLVKKPTGMPWMDRRQLAHEATELLRGRQDKETALSLLTLLVEDPKWDVRLAVAEALPFLSDDEFIPLAARLCQDTNAFVVEAADRALEQRHRGAKETHHKIRVLEDLLDDYQKLEKMHGRPLAEQSRRLGKRLYELLVGAAVHDMRSLLTSLKSNTASLQAQLQKSKPDLATMLTKVVLIKDRLDFLERLFNDMQVYSQDPFTAKSHLRLKEVILEAQEMAWEGLRYQGVDHQPVKLLVNLPDRVSLTASRHQMVVAIANVLKNAYEAFLEKDRTLSTGVIHLDAEVLPDKIIQIVIQDNGMGITEEDLREVREFMPGRTSKKSYGTGFGLPIARKNLLAHRGTIDIDSWENKGTKVTITIPREVPEGDDE